LETNCGLIKWLFTPPFYELPLPLLTFKEFLDFRQKAAGQSIYFVLRNAYDIKKITSMELKKTETEGYLVLICIPLPVNLQLLFRKYWVTIAAVLLIAQSETLSLQ
jgi:hypothetical protein